MVGILDLVRDHFEAVNLPGQRRGNGRLTRRPVGRGLGRGAGGIGVDHRLQLGVPDKVATQMDIAGGIAAAQRARGRVATVAVDAMTFHLPVYIGDVLCVYAEIAAVGRTSITIEIEAWALRRSSGERIRVTAGRFVFVALDKTGRPRPVTQVEANQ